MPLCPKCGSEVAPADTHCMDCGVNLVEAREKERQVLREQSLAARMATGPVGVPANPAAAGVVGVGEKSSDETRIRAFDRQEAERLAEERKTAWVTALMAGIIGLVLLMVGHGRIGAGGGYAQVSAVLKPAAMREFGVFANATFLGVMFLALGLAGVLIGVGQACLAMATSRAISDVKNNLKPEIVHISTFTIIGLFVVCVFCPPLGLLVGLLFFFGRNPDMKSIGGNMALVSVAVVVLLGLNMLWGVAESFRSSARAKTPG